jgi:hypothetical protein
MFSTLSKLAWRLAWRLSPVVLGVVIGSWIGLAIVQAQTRHGLEQIKSPPAPVTGIIVAANGNISIAQIGPGITLSTVNGVLTLSALSTAPTPTSTPRVYGATATASSANPLQYAIPTAAKPNSLIVYLDGLRMSPSRDYTVIGPNLIQFVTHYSSLLPPVVVVVDYDPAA